MRVTSTFLSTYVAVLENHKDFNSSTSLKYLLLFTGECVLARAQTHTHTCVRAYVHVCICRVSTSIFMKPDLNKYEGRYNL